MLSIMIMRLTRVRKCYQNIDTGLGEEAYFSDVDELSDDYETDD